MYFSLPLLSGMLAVTLLHAAQPEPHGYAPPPFQAVFQQAYFMNMQDTLLPQREML